MFWCTWAELQCAIHSSVSYQFPINNSIFQKLYDCLISMDIISNISQNINVCYLIKGPHSWMEIKQNCTTHIFWVEFHKQHTPSVCWLYNHTQLSSKVSILTLNPNDTPAHSNKHTFSSLSGHWVFARLSGFNKLFPYHKHKWGNKVMTRRYTTRLHILSQCRIK